MSAAPAVLVERTASRFSTTASRQPEVLLTAADHYGTLAAARSLGRAGIGVVVADSHPLGATRWSRLVSRVVSCPDPSREPPLFLERLLDLGRREPGRVLFAANDDLAWLYAAHAKELRRYYLLYSPPLDTMVELLNKWRLHRACVELGVATPPTWLPRTPSDLEQLRDHAAFPVVVKPQTQAFLHPHRKGVFAAEREALLPLYEDLRTTTSYARFVTERDPGVVRPIVQGYTAARDVDVYSVSGFIDASRDLFAVRASRKLLQWPSRLGVGLCFEAAPVLPEITDAVARVCRRVGFYGAFEVEFIEGREGRPQLIDFNPRFYGQMGFDIARGLDLPLLAYQAAVGAWPALRRLIDRAATETASSCAAVYCNRIELEITLRLRRLAGAVASDEVERWRSWLAAHDGASDAVLDRSDWLPGAAEATAAVVRRVLHPRSTWRAARER